MNKFKQLLLCGSVLFFASSASAVPITGSLGMTGGFYAVDVNGAVVNDASVATGIDFNFFGHDMFRATGGDGAFTGLAGQVGNITDFQFESFSAPIANFWSIDDFAFKLTDISRGLTNDPKNFLVLNGVGTITSTSTTIDFDATVADWSFTGDTSGSGLFSWSASSSPSSVVVASVPEPGTLLLLSAGLVGVFGSSLRKKVL